MDRLNIWDSEYRFMTIVWEYAPIASGKLVTLCQEKLGWKKSTTFNAIRRLSEKELIKNENAVVSVIVPKEQVQAVESDIFMERTFNGSIPQFLASFLSGKAISEKEAAEIKLLIDKHREGQD